MKKPEDQTNEEWLADHSKPIKEVNNMSEILTELKKPFDPKLVHTRPGGGGKILSYLDARDVMRRLDQVCGVHWQCRYPFEGCCEIGINIPDATGKDAWVWRSNGAGATNIEGEKGQYSDSFKRAAVMWGVGRYLYYLKNLKKGQDGKVMFPEWALPENYDQFSDVWAKI